MSYIVPLRPEALAAWQALGEALDRNDYQVPCTGAPDVWWPEPPTSELVEYAENRCRRCPVLELCGAYADAAREKGGVWGGKYREAKVGRPATTNAEDPDQHRLFA